MRRLHGRDARAALLELAPYCCSPCYSTVVRWREQLH
jgi:hypothetical protein